MAGGWVTRRRIGAYGRQNANRGRTVDNLETSWPEHDEAGPISGGWASDENLRLPAFQSRRDPWRTRGSGGDGTRGPGARVHRRGSGTDSDRYLGGGAGGGAANSASRPR